MAVQVGDTAPAFSANNRDNQPVSLSEYHGKKNVFLVFFPFAFSGVCSIQLPRYNSLLADFDSRDTEVIAVSADSGLSQNAWCESLGGITFPMLSDQDLAIAKAYDMALPGGHAGRGEFLIDKGGSIRWINIEDALGNDTPSMDDIFSAIDAIN